MFNMTKDEAQRQTRAALRVIEDNLKIQEMRGVIGESSGISFGTFKWKPPTRWERIKWVIQIPLERFWWKITGQWGRDDD
jgi:hypothetical protein